MRRNDREITDSREILSIVNECKVIRLAMLDEQGLPYIIPLNFGYRFADGVFTFYCHSAREGRKLELLRRDILRGDEAFTLEENVISEIFLDNLKSATPWVIKLRHRQRHGRAH